MNLRRVDLLWLDLHLRNKHVSVLGTEIDRPVVIVRILTDSVEGWGECAALARPDYSDEYAEGAWTLLKSHLLPTLVEAARSGGGRLPGPGEMRSLFGAVRGNRMAKACVEMALVDAGLRHSGRSLAEALEVSRDRVPAGAVIGLSDTGVGEGLGRMLAEAEGLLAEGFERLKVKIAPGSGAAALRSLRSGFPDAALQADANGSFRVDDPDHMKELESFDDLDLLCVEQPLDPDDLLGHRLLARRLRTPVCLDESVTSFARAEEAIILEACDMICIKPARLGGILEAIATHDLCRKAGVPVWCGGMLETGLARAANAALAALPGFTLPGDLSGGERFCEPDPFLAGEEPRRGHGSAAMVSVRSSPGVGPEPDLDLLRAVTNRECRIVP
jgi:o-succinylbenzoate synthase